SVPSGASPLVSSGPRRAPGAVGKGAGGAATGAFVRNPGTRSNVSATRYPPPASSANVVVAAAARAARPMTFLPHLGRGSHLSLRVRHTGPTGRRRPRPAHPCPARRRAWTVPWHDHATKAHGPAPVARGTNDERC